MLLWAIVMRLPPSAILLSPPATAQGRKEKCASRLEGKGVCQIRRYSLQQHAQKHDQNTPDHTQHQNRGDRLFVLCCDHGEQVCVLTPHPDEAWVAPAAGVEGSKCVYMLASVPNSCVYMKCTWSPSLS